MKKILINSVLVLLLTVFFSACKDTVDLQGPYEENVYVFGFLDASQTTQKIKIYKVFSGANGVQSAQNLDSIYYKNGELNVRLEEYKVNGEFTKNINLLYANDGKLEPGTFNTNNAVYYYTNEPILVNRNYKLVINAKTKTVTSELIKVSDSSNFEKTFPSIANLGDDIVNRQDVAVFGFKDTARTLGIKLGESPNVKGVNLKIKFTYGNYNSLAALINKESVVYDLKNVSFTGTAPNETVSFRFNMNDFCTFLGNNVKFNTPAVAYQRALNMDFTFTTFDKETETYMISQNQSTGLSQEKLSYSNIKNGLGFIGARNMITYFRDARGSGPDNINKVIGRNSFGKRLGFGIGN